MEKSSKLKKRLEKEKKALRKKNVRNIINPS